jgi:hypothetical protein
MTKKKSVLDKLKNVKIPKRKPLWQGPESDGPQGGITQSLLGGYLVCKERFRLVTVEGLMPQDEFSHALEYGNIWHLCEEVHAAGKDWKAELLNYGIDLRKKYPGDQVQIEKWFQVCKVQFPIYLKFWGKEKKREELLQEVSFQVPYKLPSGRTVYLRGKWDSVYQEGKGVWLKENKTKGTVDDERIQKQLTFDMQTMIYLVALKSRYTNVRGVLYNVVRRPLSGGKGSIRQHKPTKKNPNGESATDYYGRLTDIIEEEPEDYFKRWKVAVSATDIKRFEEEFLQPCLEELCNWWCLVSDARIHGADYWRPYNYRTPFGIWNPLFEGRTTNLDNYLETGDMLGLKRGTQLFPELQES